MRQATTTICPAAEARQILCREWAKAMRHIAMQALTWGTIAGSIGSALLLAALQDPPARHAVELPSLSPLSMEPTWAGRGRIAPTAASVSDAASAPHPATR